MPEDDRECVWVLTIRGLCAGPPSPLGKSDHQSQMSKTWWQLVLDWEIGPSGHVFEPIGTGSMTARLAYMGAAFGILAKEDQAVSLEVQNVGPAPSVLDQVCSRTEEQRGTRLMMITLLYLKRTT
jgi:hypothetical protein